MDTEWFARLRGLQAPTREVFAILEPTQDVLHARRREFEASGYTSNPNLVPEHIQIQQFVDSTKALHELEKSIQDHEQSRAIQEAYTARISEIIANNDMVIAAAKGDKQAFLRANEYIYGQPDPQMFGAACMWIRHDAAASMKANTDLAKRASRIVELIPEQPGTAEALIPQETTFHAVKSLHTKSGGYYDSLFGPHLPQGKVVSQETGDAICKAVLQNIAADYSLAFAENGIWAILFNEKTLVRPPGYTLPREEFIGIVSHEIGSHILEAINGAKQPLRLLETGLDRYEFGSEGRAFLREQIVYDSEATFLQQPSWEYIVALHVAVSLSVGAYDHPYNFAELYEVLYALFSFWRNRRYPGGSNNEQSARDEAWLLAVRVQKGTDGQGGAYMKDIVYLEGNVNCWRVAQDKPELIMLGDLGKFDVANPRHIQILEELRITNL